MSETYTIRNKHYTLKLWDAEQFPSGSCSACALEPICHNANIPDCFIDDKSAYFVEVNVDKYPKVLEIINNRINEINNLLQQLKVDPFLMPKERDAINSRHNRAIFELTAIKTSIEEL